MSYNIFTLVKSISNNIFSTAIDSQGNVYFTDGNYIKKYTVSTGIVSIIAGTGTAGNGNNQVFGSQTAINKPKCIAIDRLTGDVYFSDSGNHTIRKIMASDNKIYLVAGSGSSGFYGDGGLATSAQLNNPTGIAFDSLGNLYIADTNNYRVRKVVGSSISTIAGSGSNTGGEVDGMLATSASILLPESIAVDILGNLYIAETNRNRIRRVNISDNKINTVAGYVDGGGGYNGDQGLALSIRLNNPIGIALDASGNLYIADTNNNRVRKVTGDNITTIAGSTSGFSGDGYLSDNAKLDAPTGIALDASGNLYISDSKNNRIRKLIPFTQTPITPIPTSPSPSDKIYTIIKTDIGSNKLNRYSAIDSSGNVYFSETDNNVIKKYSIGGITTIIAGVEGQSTIDINNGVLAKNSKINKPTGIAIDRDGNVYFCNSGTNHIRRINTRGIISTIAGGGTDSQLTGVLGTSVKLNNTNGITVDSSGNVYIADTGNNVIRKITKNGIITTIAGNGTSGYTGDGQADSNSLDSPNDVAVDSSGNIYIADTNNNLIRMVTLSNGVYMMTTIAGTVGILGYFGDGNLAIYSQLNYPISVEVDNFGNIYIADRGNNVIRIMNSYNGYINRIAGTYGQSGFIGDGGPALEASLSNITGISIDSSGNIYISNDHTSNIFNIRKLIPFSQIPTPTPTPTPTPVNLVNPNYSIFTVMNAANSLGSLKPYNTAIDSLGNIYTQDSNLHIIKKYSVSTGTIAIIAGTNNSAGFLGDGGMANVAKISEPKGIVIDSSGSIYISDTGNNRIRKINTYGIISTIAGTGTAAYSGDGDLAINSSLNALEGIALDSSGNLYIADTGNNVIRKITTNGIITTIAGTGTGGFTGDGQANSNQLTSPRDVAVDSLGNIYIADTGNQCIRMVTLSNGIYMMTTIAGTGTAGGGGDEGLAIYARLNNPCGIEVDYLGRIYIADTGNKRIRMMSSYNGYITTVAGTGFSGNTGDGGLALNATLNTPNGISIDPSNNLYISDSSGLSVRKLMNVLTPPTPPTPPIPIAMLNNTYSIARIAGTPSTAGFSGDGSVATSALLNKPFGIAIDSSNNFYIADTDNNRVRKFVIGGNITTISTQQLTKPKGIAVDKNGNIYISDSGANVIRKITNGLFSIITGQASSSGSNGDGGLATSAKLNNPTGIAVDSSGNVYIADTNNHAIRKIEKNGIITTVAGVITSGGYTGEGQANVNKLNTPNDVAVDSLGNIYIADTGNHRVRMVTLSNGFYTMTTIAGTGTALYNGDGGLAINATLNNPTGIKVDSSGQIYIADNGNNVIRMMSSYNGYITTIAGTGAAASSGSNGSPAINAAIYTPTQIALDSSGKIYIAELNSHIIRQLTGPPIPTPTPTPTLRPTPTPTPRPDNPICFNEGTKILCLNKNFEEEYIPIENLRKGDTVKTYLHGYKKIDLIGKNQMINNPDINEKCMYKMESNESNELIEDLIITGGHSILVNDLGNNYNSYNKFYNGDVPKIDDKFLVFASISSDFVKLKNNDLYTYYHFILENDGDESKRYGVWSNGILTETPTKKCFLESNMILI